MKKHLLILSLLAASLGACDPGNTSPDAAPHPEYHILVWVDPASGLPEDEMLDGCDLWAPVGVGCELTEEFGASDVQIYADTDPCEENSDGSITLAWASCCGRVVFIRECFRRSDGQLDRDALRVVSTHEVGHQFGLWWHVPRSCAGNPPRHPDGGKVCGTAVMNPFFNSSLHELQEPDVRAFDIREKEFSVADHENHHHGETGEAPNFTCVYTTEP